MFSEFDAVSATDLLPLASHLRALEVGWRLLDVEALAAFELLADLTIQRWHYEDVTALAGVKALRCQFLNEAQKVADVRGLPPNLNYFHMTYASKLTDLSPLTALRDLSGLALEPANRLTDLGPLGSIPSLRLIHLEGKLLADPSPLTGHPGTEVLIWHGRRAPNMPEVVASMPSIRHLVAPTTAKEDRSWRPFDLEAAQLTYQQVWA